MKIRITCMEHRCAVGGDPILTLAEGPGAWNVDTSDMYCTGNPEPGDDPEGYMCNESWRVLL